MTRHRRRLASRELTSVAAAVGACLQLQQVGLALRWLHVAYHHMTGK